MKKCLKNYFRKKRTPVYALLADVLSITVAIALVNVHASDAKVAEAVTVGQHWKDKASGLKGERDDAREDFEKSEEEGEEKDGRIDAQNKRLGDLIKQIGEMTDQLAKLQPAEALELCVIQDVSGSQEPHINRLRATLKSLFDWLPYLARSCKISVLGIRDGVVYQYPLTEIMPAYKDKGLSQAKLLKFMDGMQTQTSMVNHTQAFEQAFAMLDGESKTTQRQVIVVGDFGCSEIDNRVGHSPAERQHAAKLVRDAQEWASRGDHHSIASVYVGASGTLDEQWFRDLANPRESHFTTDSADLFRFILSSIRPKGFSNEKN